ncbi:hypothetical protein PHLGIDRAFT_35715 [Phlebiopsis gigantea 11061_1 CR5-6]|uniref:SGTA homodimerisation domain-containing protein n=1 Tax=Phlebiopsis gigantea (strain 11061_1 CR5-6) TaxID=745531 RepID=A0A0C3S7S4_PHLG1|nr:hypothetical protein PHLGIDRAFT_35715 [Phlebiopsis gigantea 11061_1 CR5-6]
MSDKQPLVLSIIDFLNQSIQDGTVKQDDQESLEVAIQCIGEAFGVDPSDEAQRDKLSVKPATLQSIFDVFIKTREKMGSTGPASTPTSTSTAAQPNAPSADDKAAAEKLKAQGNAKMSTKEYDAAIEFYGQAIAKDATNPVYYSNRAAAYSSKNDHINAVKDAEDALIVDPSFVRAYHRLGHAHYCLNDFKAAADAFKRGLEVDPSNANLKSGLQSAEARITPDDDELPSLESTAPTTSGRGSGAGAGLGGMADMLRGMGMGGNPGAGGAGGAGGMPDLSSILSNPAMMQMAQQMMQNGGLENLMSNPAVANMMNSMQSSGGMPSMDELLSDPTMRNLDGIIVLTQSVVLANLVQAVRSGKLGRVDVFML